MNGPRFKVATCEGYRTNAGSHRSGEPGVSVSVLDTFYTHRVIRTFRSEDWPTRRRWAARYGAVVEAQRLAEQLNSAE